jgi:cell division protein FtsB
MRSKQWRKILLLGALLSVIVWLLLLIWGLADKAHVAVTQANEVRGQYQVLQERKAVLETQLAALASDRGQDTAIRTAFGVARPDEEVIVVVPPEKKMATSTVSWWQRMFSWFQ